MMSRAVWNFGAGCLPQAISFITFRSCQILGGVDHGS